MKKSLHLVQSPLLLLLLLPALAMLCTAPPKVLADQYPGDTLYYQLVEEIDAGVKANSIDFYRLLPGTNTLEIRYNGLTQTHLCEKLAGKHNRHNAAVAGGTISASTCTDALSTGGSYDREDWNAWAGTHCGTWYSIDGKTFTDNAKWNKAGYDRTYTGVFRQDVDFITRSKTCRNGCRRGWNLSSRNVSASSGQCTAQRSTIVHTCWHTQGWGREAFTPPSPLGEL